VDLRPPRSDGDEREVLLVSLTYQRESLLRKVEGLSEADARRALVPSGTTLLWLIKHVAAAEHIWLHERFGGRRGVLGGDVTDADTIASAVEAYRASWPDLDAVIRGNDLARAIPDPTGDTVPLTLRWIVVHLIEELARHAGHADILRELIDGDTGR
jgi:uncharacterized damage-inducible protein DinB